MSAPRARKSSWSVRSSDGDAKSSAIPIALFNDAHCQLIRLYNDKLRGSDTFIFPFTPMSSVETHIPIRGSTQERPAQVSYAKSATPQKYVPGVSFATIGYQVHATVDAANEHSSSEERVIGRFSLTFEDGKLELTLETPNRRNGATHKSFLLCIHNTGNFNDDELLIEDATKLTERRCATMHNFFEMWFKDVTPWRADGTTVVVVAAAKPAES